MVCIICFGLQEIMRSLKITKRPASESLKWLALTLTDHDQIQHHNYPFLTVYVVLLQTYRTFSYSVACYLYTESNLVDFDCGFKYCCLSRSIVVSNIVKPKVTITKLQTKTLVDGNNIMDESRELRFQHMLYTSAHAYIAF